MEGSAATGGIGRIMIVETSIPNSTRARISVRHYIGPSIILCVLFLSAFVRDVPLEGAGLTSWRRDFVDAFNVETQFWLSGAVVAYLLFFAVANWKRFPPRTIGLLKNGTIEERDAMWFANLLLLPILVCALYRYISQYKEAGSGTDALVLLVCIVLNQWLIWVVAGRKQYVAERTRKAFINLFILLGCACVFLTPLLPDPNAIFHGQYRYHDRVRWSGIWQNPNIFGLLMAVVLLFCIARAWSAMKRAVYAHSMIWSAPAAIAFLSVVKSYSRGAWVTTGCGLLFLFWNSFRAASNHPAATAQKMKLKTILVWSTVGFVIGFVFICGLKIAADAQVSFVQRVLSVFSNRDFSSQNRLASYQDGINMLLDQPWSGYGWDNIISIHTALYLQSGLSTGDAIKLNDFLMFSLRFGVPIFAVFTLYLWIWLSAGTKNSTQSRSNSDILLCRMATLMLAIGFMFTDGLFRLATGGSFWLFLTLSFNFAALSASRNSSHSAG